MSQVVVSRGRAILSLLLALSVLLVGQVALAAGRVEWKSKDLDEREGGSWRLEVSFFMGRAPDVAHVPMKFEFQPIAYYERAMMDGDKLVERVVPLDNRQALIESVDVGFLDSGSGKIESRTRFSFKVTRAHGYEAGEYKVTIRDGRNGQTVGAATTLKFKGENEIIDRRAMVFSGGDKKKKKKDADGEAKEGGGEEKKADKPADDGAGGGDKPADDSAPAAKEGGSDEGSGSDSSGDEAGTIKEKPGGCGCRVPGGTSRGGGLGVGLALMLGLGVVARRRSRLNAP